MIIWQRSALQTAFFHDKRQINNNNYKKQNKFKFFVFDICSTPFLKSFIVFCTFAWSCCGGSPEPISKDVLQKIIIQIIDW